MPVGPLPLKHVLRFDEVPDDGVAVAIAAAPDERAALAAYLDVPDVRSATADLTVTRWRRRGLAVRGSVDAEVVQTSVVTLEPVENRVREAVETFFAPGVAAIPEDGTLDPEAVSEMDVEPLVDGRVDLGALVCEHLVLGLDPYPRRDGEVFQREGGDGDDEVDSGAFAALAALRGDSDET